MTAAGRLRPAVLSGLLAITLLSPALAAEPSGSDDPRAAAAYEALADYLAADPAARDIARATETYEKAVAAGSVTALIKLAALLAARPGEADARRAADLLREAIARGAAGPAGNALGDLHRDDPRLRDPALALLAYAEAAAVGYPGAGDKLAAIIAAGTVTMADSDTALAVLERATMGANPAPAAMVLAGLYAAGSSRADLTKARRNFEIAAAGGIGAAHLALAEMDADRYQDPRIRREVLDHYLAAATLLGVEPVAVRLGALPQPALLALVRDLIVQRGLGVVPLAGPDAQNPDVVAGFCRDRARYYCSEQSIPWEMLVELIGGSAGGPARP